MRRGDKVFWAFSNGKWEADADSTYVDPLEAEVLYNDDDYVGLKLSQWHFAHNVPRDQVFYTEREARERMDTDRGTRILRLQAVIAEVQARQRANADKLATL